MIRRIFDSDGFLSCSGMTDHLDTIRCLFCLMVIGWHGGCFLFPSFQSPFVLFLVVLCFLIQSIAIRSRRNQNTHSYCIAERSYFSPSASNYVWYVLFCIGEIICFYSADDLIRSIDELSGILSKDFLEQWKTRRILFSLSLGFPSSQQIKPTDLNKILINMPSERPRTVFDLTFYFSLSPELMFVISVGKQRVEWQWSPFRLLR